MQDRYINSELYHLAVSDLETIARTFDPADPNDVRSAIIQILGENLNIWPEDCFIEQEARTPRIFAA